MSVELFKRTWNGVIYLIRDSDGRLIGQVDWIMAGANVGIHYYSRDARYKPPKIRKIFRHCYRDEISDRFQIGG